MPLRDHFHPPLSEIRGWDALHGAWPTVMVLDLNRRLPERFVASPRIHLGPEFEIDVAASDTEPVAPAGEAEVAGGSATALWAPPKPTRTLETQAFDADEYEVLIHHKDGRLVAAVEVVSPSNKDRPESRRTFVAKCAALVRRGVAVSVVDVVTVPRFNLFSDLLELFGHSGASSAEPIYAAACRWRSEDVGLRTARRFDTWENALRIGGTLPVLPLWLASDLAIPLDLELTYEETCRGLRIR